MAKKDIPGPTYKAITKEIEKVVKVLSKMKPEETILRERVNAALRNLAIAQGVLYCGQSQSALDPGTDKKMKAPRPR